ncbi:MAG: ATP synthase subunit I [Syntrophales bacterium]|nr:ATP synthase subunit I [Syntrophales bacterium]
MTGQEKDPLLKKIEFRSWLVVGLLVAVSIIFRSMPVTLGILIGGVICSLNFRWMYRDASLVLTGPADKASRYMVLRFYIRLVVTGIVLFIIISRTPVNIIALVVGLSSVVITIIPTVILENTKKKSTRRLNKRYAPLLVF